MFLPKLHFDSFLTTLMVVFVYSHSKMYVIIVFFITRVHRRGDILLEKFLVIRVH